MFVHDRDSILDGLGKLGAGRCSYCIGPDGHDWLSTRCDCKYGGAEHGRWAAGSEQTGCPELRAIYLLVASMTDAEWEDLRTRAGCIDPAAVAEAIQRKFSEGGFE